MRLSFVVDEKTKHSLADRTLLLDTNALIDIFRLPTEFYDLGNEFLALGCSLIATRTIVLEFLGGTKDEGSIKKKKLFLETLFGKPLDKLYLPLDHTPPNLDDLLIFSRYANRFSMPDYELFCTLKKYGSGLALITRNHKDFSTNLVHRLSFITLLGKAEIHTYSVCTLYP